jgi:hypothetical protein
MLGDLTAFRFKTVPTLVQALAARLRVHWCVLRED